MSDGGRYLFAAFFGACVGGFFFASLWWTVRQLPDSRQPAILFAASFLIRMAIVFAGFYALARNGDWKLLVAAGLGFTLARGVGIRMVTPPSENEGRRDTQSNRLARSTPASFNKEE